MRGWFDAFRNDGGPTLYNFNNRTPVTGDVTLITLYVIFATLYFAFLVIFPGIRKEVNRYDEEHRTEIINFVNVSEIHDLCLGHLEFVRRNGHIG
jgi:hypothetical protein